MKGLTFGLLLSISLIACKDCIECRYATSKGSSVEKFCSSTKSDRENFIADQEAAAAAIGSQAICTKETY